MGVNLPEMNVAVLVWLTGPGVTSRVNRVTSLVVAERAIRQNNTKRTSFV